MRTNRTEAVVMGASETDKRFRQAATEAANRAEATALLIRCGYRVYRPEADIEGEDLVLRQPAGSLIPVQLKPRVYVDGPRYHGLGLWMLFPVGPFVPAAPRPWFLTPHDPLFAEVERRHRHTPKWTGCWHTGHPSAALRDYLARDEVRPPPETADDADIARPRLTPQGHASDGKEDSTDPAGGAKHGQGDKAEG